MRLLFDADGVLLNFTQALCDYINTWPDPAGKRSRVWTSDACDVYPMHALMNEHELYVAKASESDQYFLRRVKPYEGASKLITELRLRGHEIRIITAYGVLGHVERAHQLLEHFDVPERHIIFCNAKEKQYMQGDALVEDREDTVRQWALRQKKPAFIVDRPWTRTKGIEYSTPQVARLQKLEDLLLHV